MPRRKGSSLPVFGSDLKPKDQQSSAISSLSYDIEDQQVECVFNARGTYVYYDVPPETFAEWNGAGSRGTYFNLYIRDRFSFERIA